MKIAQTCQGDTLANIDQEGPNVKKQQKYVMQTQLHGTTFRRLDYKLKWYYTSAASKRFDKFRYYSNLHKKILHYAGVKCAYTYRYVFQK